ncbi:MAG TPA: hypothetical protein PKI19_06285 [Elusimicrobiales bacterium]|nr:hypothetical protein [Elusimicrobiales bacterium]
MENEKVVVLQLKVTRLRCLLALAFAFICIHAKSVDSETLTLTTYYPAPYGGYVSLLTTGAGGVNTLLARDNGRVGVGGGVPTTKLDVNGDFRSKGLLLDTVTHDGVTTPIWGGWNEALRLENASHAAINFPTGGILFGMHSNRNFYWADTTNGYYSMWLTPEGNLSTRNDLTVGGTLRGLCTRVGYTTASGDDPCPAGSVVTAAWGNGASQLLGFLPASAAMTVAAGTYMNVGHDWNGTMVCCKLEAL